LTKAWVIFTDLDGTLLDHTTYRWTAARRALAILRRRAVPLVIVTSKTCAEVLPILRALRRREPFVVENGGAIYFPEGYFPSRIAEAAPATRGLRRVKLGAPRRRLVAALIRAGRRGGVRVRSFAAMGAREVAERTGMTLLEARRATRREFDEPFVLLDRTDRAWERLRAEIRRQGFHVTRGSRFFHILGNNDKGAAVHRLMTWFQKAVGTEVRSVGLGDSPNDIPMLRAVDVPVLVGRPGAPEGLVPWDGTERLCVCWLDSGKVGFCPHRRRPGDRVFGD
jgi:mannosyl-3-phosphoglycerate phosphatase